MASGFVPNRNRVDGTCVARAQQPFPFHRVRRHEDGGAAFVEDKRFGGFGNAVAEADTEGAVDAHPQLAHVTFFEIAHMPSRPSSARAVSMTAGVISVIPRSFA